MGDNVVAIRENVSADSRRKAAFLDNVAASFDQYVADFECEPDSVVYVLGGLKQTARSGWINSGDSEGGPTTMLALAMSTLVKDIVNP